MIATLKAALGAHVEDRGGALCAVPGDERALVEVLHVLKDRGARLGREVHLSRARLASLGPIETRSMTVEAGAGVTLAALEEALRPKSLTLGPLPPSAWALTLADFLEGPLAGLRAIPGGRLEPLCARVEGVLADGRTVVTQPGPRAAAGPDLAALFLGAGGRLGLVTRALVRAQRAPHHRISVSWKVPGPRAVVSTLRRVLADGALLSRALVGLVHGELVVQLTWAGSEGLIERERELLERAFAEAGGRLAGERSPAVPEGSEVELSWDDVELQLTDELPLELHRLSLSSVVAVGGRPGALQDAWPFARGLALALDPSSVLGGAP